MCTSLYMYIAKLLGYSNHDYKEFILIDQEVSFIFNLFKIIWVLGYNKLNTCITNHFRLFPVQVSHHRKVMYISSDAIIHYWYLLISIKKNHSTVHKICTTKSCFVLISPIIKRHWTKTSWKYLQTHKVDMVKWFLG